MYKAKDWGLIVYEQDWLMNQFLEMNATLTDIYLAENWMLNMNKAAKALSITIQLCGPLPSHVLQSVNMSQVTQLRASPDYQRQVYNANQWSIGYTSILYNSLGVYPFKDCFWSNSSIQYGCNSNASSCQEPNPLLHTLVAALSAGPVAPSDKMGYPNLKILMQATRADGVLLKPDIPARTMDLAFSMGFKFGPTLYNLTSTYSSHIIQDNVNNPTFKWHYILAADTLQAINITPTDLGESPDNPNLYFYDYFRRPTVLIPFNQNSPLMIPALYPTGPKSTVSYRYYVVFQVSNSYSLVGERKFAVASKQRFKSITKSTQGNTTITTMLIEGHNEPDYIQMFHTPSQTLETYYCYLYGLTKFVCTENETTHSCLCWYPFEDQNKVHKIF
jgi:hypothetical protein